MTIVNVVNQENLNQLKTAINGSIASGSFLPSAFVLEMTNRCNVNCIMCPNKRFVESELGDISTQTFDRIIDEISPTAEITMFYFLGESTLHPNFAELLRSARQRLRGKIVISTNAFQLSDKTIACLAECADIVIVCIDRWHKEEYEKVRKGSSFENVVDTAERLICERGKKDFPVVLVKALDIKFSSELPEALNNERDDFISYWEQRGAIPLVGWLNTWAGQFPNLKRLATIGNPYSTQSRPACADLWFKAVINWRGEVVLCCHDWRSTVTLGSLQDESLSVIWHAQRIAELRSNHIRGNFSCTELCRGCNEWGEAEELESYVRLNQRDLYKVF
jgi:MoaA/NifB/PqqE/SkfB family radical SAM enzyme